MLKGSDWRQERGLLYHVSLKREVFLLYSAPAAKADSTICSKLRTLARKERMRISVLLLCSVHISDTGIFRWHLSEAQKHLLLAYSYSMRNFSTDPIRKLLFVCHCDLLCMHRRG
jgi:hypothetical protein